MSLSEGKISTLKIRLYCVYPHLHRGLFLSGALPFWFLKKNRKSSSGDGCNHNTMHQFEELWKLLSKWTIMKILPYCAPLKVPQRLFVVTKTQQSAFACFVGVQKYFKQRSIRVFNWTGGISTRMQTTDGAVCGKLNFNLI